MVGQDDSQIGTIQMQHSALVHSLSTLICCNVSRDVCLHAEFIFSQCGLPIEPNEQ